LQSESSSCTATLTRKEIYNTADLESMGSHQLFDSGPFPKLAAIATRLQRSSGVLKWSLIAS